MFYNKAKLKVKKWGIIVSKIAILSDSGCQIELGQYENQGIFIVPLCITMENETYLDQKDISSIEVFETMDRENIMVMTSQPPTGEMVKILQKIKDAGYDEVIGLPIATGLSSTLNGMKVAADMVEIPITLIDTKGTAGNHKYLTFTAAKLVQEGKNAQEIQKIMESMVEDSGTIIVAPNLDHLKKGGSSAESRESFPNRPAVPRFVIQTYTKSHDEPQIMDLPRITHLSCALLHDFLRSDPYERSGRISSVSRSPVLLCLV